MQDFYGFFYESNTFYKVIFILITSVITLFFAEKVFYKLGFVDRPNYRSNHNKPIALGGGIVFIPLIIIATIIFKYEWNKFVLTSLSLLFLISLIDDIKNVKPFHRLVVHFISSSIFVFLFINFQIQDFIEQSILFYYFGTIFMILSITWFINAFNFMDGINGISSIEIMSICLSLMIINFFLQQEINVLAFSIFIITSVFIYFNWTPSRLFLGDSGSIPLGFLSSYLLIELTLEGFWVSAILLPLYYVMDASVTLLLRVYKRKKFWKAHSEHYYQQAIKNGLSHSGVSLRLLLINIGLFLLSFSAVIYKNELIFMVLGLIWCSFFMYLFSKKTNSL